MTDAALVDRLCDLAGIPSSYLSAEKEPRDVAVAARLALLSALGYPAGSDHQARRSLAALVERLNGAILPPVVVARDDQRHVVVPLHLPRDAAGPVSWSISGEGGGRTEGQVRLDMSSGLAPGRVRVPVGIGIGYHRLSIALPDGQRAETRLIVAPRRCHRPASLEDDGKRWGLAVQLYSLRSQRNWGIGDFTDLAAVMRLAARLGAAAVGLNPLHALFTEEPARASPYSPSSRLYLNPIYLDPEAIAEHEDNLAVRAMVEDEDFRARLAAARAADLVDYDGVWRLKAPVLELLFDAFRHRHLRDDDRRAREFHAFCQRQGRELTRFAVFQALTNEAPAMGWRADWRTWPEPYRDPDSDVVAGFARAHADEILFHQYLQWQAEAQLDAARQVGTRLGLSIGLYHDLAVGADPRGAEVWSNQALSAAGVSLGAPPDSWNPRGQDWGLAATNPLAMRSSGYASFAAMLRANMRRGGAIRIDHILGLMRQFWIPHGSPPRDGAYVHFPLEELLAVIALESRRSQCLVIGEDLGTVPEGLDEALLDAGILTYRLLYFEQTGDGEAEQAHPSPADRYPREALVAVGTHDLPTLPAYWQAEDLRLRDHLGLWPTPELREREYARREADRAGLIDVLQHEGLLAQDEPADVPIAAVHTHLGLTPCRLLMVGPPDLHDWFGQHNLPGTEQQYPNWRQRLPSPIETWSQDQGLRGIAMALEHERSDHWGIDRRAARQPAPASRDRERAPRASYRLQLNAAFTLDDASRLVRYLARLGISHVYASPWLKARRGSGHGYDVADHNLVNPELGGLAALDHFSEELESHGLGQILDFVPNHMGVGRDNPMWWDVLTWGRDSAFAPAFDIDWFAPDDHVRDKVLVPVLGDHPDPLVARGEIGLRFDPAAGRFSVRYADHRFPVSAASHVDLLRAAADGIAWQDDLPREGAVLRPVADEFRRELRAEALDRLHAQLAGLCRKLPSLGGLLCRFAEELATNDPARVLDLLDRQHYRLAFWREESEGLNYRRFFNISDLIGVRPEDESVFEEMHRFVRGQLARGALDGLRLDHIDGLFDPAGYCIGLAQLAHEQGTHPIILVEKILGRDETLRSDWPIDGSTGYEFLGMVNGLFVARQNVAPMTETYRRFTGRSSDYGQVLAEAKRFVMRNLLRPELRSLARELLVLLQSVPEAPGGSLVDAMHGIEAMAGGLAVYRTYVSQYGAAAPDRREIDEAAKRARAASDPPLWPMIDFIAAALHGKGHDGMLHFARRFQQFTGPVMAKSGEDTAFYRYHRLIALNEVGSTPDVFGTEPQEFHDFNVERIGRWSRGMLTTATHDTKRGEDARVRIDVLSEIPEEWAEEAAAWSAINRGARIEVEGQPSPVPDDEYLLYQSLLGAWPNDLELADTAARDTFRQRIGGFMTKAMREGRQRSSWTDPNAAYEQAVDSFLARLLDPKNGARFQQRFLPFQARIARMGMLNSLVQVVLKCACPGFPDFYQGTEFWDLSLVDPDNRRPVDYEARLAALARLEAWREGDAAAVAQLRDRWPDGLVKFHVMQRMLHLRRAMPDLFEWGDYRGCGVQGPRSRHVIAFSRNHHSGSLIVVAGRLFAGLIDGDATLPSPDVWEGTEVKVATRGSGRLRDGLTGKPIDLSGGWLPVGNALATLPVAVLLSEGGPGSRRAVDGTRVL